MAKKPGKSVGKSKPKTADDHRAAAQKLSARADMHHAKARMIEADNPPKKPRSPYGY